MHRAQRCTFSSKYEPVPPGVPRSHSHMIKFMIRTKNESNEMLVLWGKAVQFNFLKPELSTVGHESDCKNLV